MFSKIVDIDIGCSESWREKIFLTFDIDWCSDEVLSYTLDILEKYKIKATFFVTHKTELLKRMRENSNIELGIHPNFNPLLNGDFRYGKNIKEVLAYYKEMVPEAVSVRSHSLTTNSTISQQLSRRGFRYECNQIIPHSSGVVIKPYRHWESNFITVPHFWEDDVHILYGDKWSVESYLAYEGIKVFDFHPIHLFLNSEKLERYENARVSFHDFNNLKIFQNRDVFGTENFLIEMIEKINKKGKNNG